MSNTNDQNYELAQKISNFLNELLEIDQEAISKLVFSSVPCSSEMVNHPTVQVVEKDGEYSVSVFSILNGLCDHSQIGPIYAIKNQGIKDRQVVIRGGFMAMDDGKPKTRVQKNTTLSVRTRFGGQSVVVSFNQKIYDVDNVIDLLSDAFWDIFDAEVDITDLDDE